MPDPKGPTTPEAGTTPDHEEVPAAEDRLAVSEPTMAGAGADLASGDRPADGPAAPPQPVPTARRSMMPALLSIIGLVLIALLAVNLYLMANPPNRDLLPDLQAEVAALRQRLGTLEARPSGLASLDTRVKALESTLAQQASDLADAKSAMPAPDAAGDMAARIDALDRRAGDLDKASAGLKETVAAIPRFDLAPIEAKLAALGTDIEAVKTSVAALPKIDLAPLVAGIAALDGRLKPIEAAFAVPKAGQQVTEARREGSAAETRAAPLAVTAQAIIQALDDGKPFAPELAALGALGADGTKLSVLKPLADRGAPTRSTLSSGFASVRDGLVSANVPKVTGTVLDRMMASAQGIVQVRQAGSSPGSEPDAVASRIAAALDRNALGEALAEWEKLPDASKAASASWAEGLEQRVAAEAAARSIAAGAIAAIGSQQ